MVGDLFDLEEMCVTTKTQLIFDIIYTNENGFLFSFFPRPQKETEAPCLALVCVGMKIKRFCRNFRKRTTKI